MRSHPALATIVGILVVIIAVCAALVFWPHSAVAPEPTPGATGPVYRNETYGFAITLSDDWKRYTVVSGRWDGTLYDAAGNENGSDYGPQIVLHYPGESAENPHEAMPVMVFTIAQFKLTQAGDIGGAPFLSVSAAPFGPQELARNSKYVLALPARYNYDFKPGYEEVDVLVHTLRAFEPTK